MPWLLVQGQQLPWPMAIVASAFNSYHGNYGMTLNEQWVLVTEIITKVLSPYFPDCPIAGQKICLVMTRHIL
jgi:hypothetical protein